jgi:aldehyde dehydrogenase (NAD+)
MAKVAPALAAGCTVVLKPSEIAPLNACLLAEVCLEVGLPAGVLNIVHGTGPVVGEALVTHPAIDMVSFTGSLLAGRRIGALTGERIVKCTLELGGKSAFVILDDAPFDKAVPHGVKNAMLNSGQTCRRGRACCPARAARRRGRAGSGDAADTRPGRPARPATRPAR